MRFLRQHPLALVVVAGLLAGGLAIAAAQAPDNTEPQDFHGRTWLTASAKGGDQLVLVNGISGLIEGRSQGGATIPDGARFIDSTPTSTLVGSDEGVTVVDSGTQEAVTKQGVDGDRSALTDALVVTLGRDVRVQPASLTGGARTVPAAPTPIAGTTPVVDASSAAWYLGRSGNDRVAVKVSGSAPTIEEHDVDASTTRLLMVDGDVYAAGPKTIEQVDGGGSRTVAARSDVLPSVAVASGDLWASAEGRTITVFDGQDERTVRTGAEVVDLAVWHGDVVAATAKGAERVGGDKAERIRAIRSQATIHADGGMLWLTSKGDVVAIDRDQQQSHFRLRALDADLCIESCDPGDLAELLKDQPTPTTEPEAEKATTTTAPPRDLQSPDTEPELPTTTTTTTPTTTTEPQAPSTTIDRSPRNTTPTTEPKRSTTTERPKATSLPPPATLPPQTQPPRTQPPFTRPPETRPSETRPPLTLPPITQPPWTPPPATDPPPTDPPPTAPPPTEPVRYGLTLNVVPGDSSAQATASVVGPARPCAPFGSTGGSISWSGIAGQGSQQVALRWRGGGDQSDTVSVTIPNLQSGDLTVRFEACGVATSSRVTVEGASPDVGEIQVQTPVQVGQQFQPFVQFSLPSGWSVASANWNGNGSTTGTCTVPPEFAVETGPDFTRQVFNANSAGPCQIEVIITFVPPNGGELKSTKQGQINIDPAPTAPASAPRLAPAQAEGTKPTG